MFTLYCTHSTRPAKLFVSRFVKSVSNWVFGTAFTKWDAVPPDDLRISCGGAESWIHGIKDVLVLTCLFVSLVSSYLHHYPCNCRRVRKRRWCGMGKLWNWALSSPIYCRPKWRRFSWRRDLAGKKVFWGPPCRYLCILCVSFDFESHC